MSIWDCADFQDEDRYPFLRSVSCSGIDSLLDREDVKLEEVLRSEDLIQEVNGFNENLIDYLQKPEIAKELFKSVWNARVMVESSRNSLRMRTILTSTRPPTRLRSVWCVSPRMRWARF